MEQSIHSSLLFSTRQTIQHFLDHDCEWHSHEGSDMGVDPLIIICILDSENKTVYSSYSLSKSFLYPNKEELGSFQKIEKGKYLWYGETFFGKSKGPFTIHSFYLLEKENQRLHNLAIILLCVISLSGILGMVGAWYLAYYLLSPFRRISKEASRIRAESMQEKLVYKIPHDEVGKLSRTLNDLFDRLHRSFAALKRFTSDASHELKTPLSIIRGDIEVLLRRQRSCQEYEETLQETLKEIDRMIGLTQGLLTIAQAESKQITLEKKELSLFTMIPEILEKTEKLCSHNKKIEIDNIIKEEDTLQGNYRWVRQILENLLVNAWQYTPDQGKITIQANSLEQSSEVIISNTGPRIPPEDMPHIFDRFYRIDTGRTRKNGGFGLGLAIAKALAQAQGGNLTAKSPTNEETSFILSLPHF